MLIDDCSISLLRPKTEIASFSSQTLKRKNTIFVTCGQVTLFGDRSKNKRVILSLHPGGSLRVYTMTNHPIALPS